MSGALQLAGLLALAFIVSGGALGSRRGPGAAGLFVLLGVLAGPLGLSLIDEETRALWHPLTSLCVGWLGLLFGLRLRAGAFARAGVGGAAMALLEAGGVGALVALGLIGAGHLLGWTVPGMWAVAIAIASASSSQAALRFARRRWATATAFSRLFDRVTALDDLVPLLAMLALATVVPAPASSSWFLAWPALIPCAAVGLGLLVAVLFGLSAGRQAGADRSWLVLLGGFALAIGAASRIGAPELAAGLVAGLTLPWVASRRLLTRAAGATSVPVTVLLLVLIGSRLELARPAVALAAIALALRVAGKVGVGALLPGAGWRRLSTGLGLLGSDGLALAVAAQIELLYGGPLGEAVLTAAALQAVVGDLLGPAGLAALLQRRSPSPAGLAAAHE